MNAIAGKDTNMESHATVPIELGERSYDVHIGRNVLSTVGAELKNLFPNSRIVIVTDENVADFHLDTLTESLNSHRFKFDSITIPPGEGSKSFFYYEDLCERILATKIDRSDVVIAFGGGVVGDLVGFVASTIRRGINLVQIPTTLLAQVDSSVGGKTGINTRFGKNLIGTFCQPSVVFADTKLLESLPKRILSAGYAEVVKYGLINDAEFFAWLEESWKSIYGGGIERDEAIAKSCQAKASIVGRDEKEAGERALLNLGHTFGHALEAATEYDTNRLVHGEGVSIGMCLAFSYSEELGLCSAEDTKRVIGHLSAVGLPTRLDQIPDELPAAEVLLDHIKQDKKSSHGNLKFILTRGIGKAFIEDSIDPDHVLNFLKRKLAS